MRRVRALALAQRVVLVVALGVVLLVVGMYVASDGFAGPPAGWFGYSPQSTDTYFVVRHYSIVRTLVAPVILVIIWTAVSIWLMGPEAAQPREQEPGGPAE